MARLSLDWHRGRHQPEKDTSASSALLRGRWVERAVFSAIIIVLAVLLYRNMHPSQIWAIMVDDRPVAFVSSRITAQQILDYVLRSKAGEYASEARFRQQIAIEKADLSDGTVVDRWEAQQQVVKKLDAVIPVCQLVVNQEMVLAFSSKNEAKECLKAFVQHYIPKDAQLIGRPRFREEVILQDGLISPQKADELLMSKNAALERLFSAPVSPRKYTVKLGDVAARIARQHKVSLRDLEIANPGVDLARLQPDQRITVSGGDCLLTVVYTVQITKPRDIPCWTEFVPDVDMPPGEKKVLQEGKPGKQEVINIVTYANGKEISRESHAGKILIGVVPERISIGKKVKSYSEFTFKGDLRRF